MPVNRGTSWLVLAGSLSALAALSHFAIILGGPAWYRFFGAGEAMAQMAEAGEIYPSIITACIGLMLGIWALYAYSGAGKIARLPFIRLCLVLISLVYLGRGAAGGILAMFEQHPLVQAEGQAFWVWSSLICLGFGIVHLYGLYQQWPMLKPKVTENRQ